MNSGTDGGNSDIGVLADFFRTMKKCPRWNNYPVVEYPVVKVRGVSYIWITLVVKNLHGVVVIFQCVRQ